VAAALALRMRPDLTWSRFVSEGQDSYIFKDPITLEYTRMDSISGTLATQLDGKRTEEELIAYARAHWPGFDFSEDYIADLIADLKKMKYLDDPFEKNTLLAARARHERMQINAATFKNLFSIQLGYVDPDALLTRVYPYVAFMFRPFMVWLGITLFVFSGFVVWLNRAHIAAGAGNFMLGEGQRVLGATLIWVLITVAIIIHELGHAFAVKHHGGKVHKIGFILVFGMPCMYCETSDTHLFENWKHRVHAALAGTYTELYMASIATLVWWLTPSGIVINQLAYNIILFASISGILFNYNPLIKMDGYYVLLDTLDMPNLMEDSYEYLGYLFRRYVLRMKLQSKVRGRQRKRVLVLFGVCSIAYSVFFATIMYLFLRRWLVNHLATVGTVLALLLLLMVLRRPAGPIMRTARLWLLEHRTALVRRRLVLGAGGALLALVLLFVPVAGSRRVPVTLEPGRMAALLAPEEMRVRATFFRAGQPVAAGDVLAEFDADSAAVVQAEAAARAGEHQVAAARALFGGDLATAAAQRAGAAGDAAVSGWVGRRVARAELRAPFAGRVLTASDPSLIGERLMPGDTVCVVGDFSSLRARALVSEADLDDIRVAAPARIRLRMAPGTVWRARVSAVEALPVRREAARAYRVWFVLAPAPGANGPGGLPRAGFTGEAHLATPARTPAAHFQRWLARFVRADLWV
jgi:putative peptide zinc metalloprotease protein